MTNPKSAPAPATSDDVPRVEHQQPIVKTQELPAIDAMSLEAVPVAITDEDATLPVQSSIESTLTFEVLRRQSIKTDDDEGTR
jgi:hypothetical protein